MSTMKENYFAFPAESTDGQSRQPTAIALPAAIAAQLIGVSLSHFYQLHKTGRLPLPIRLGRAVRWLRPELEQWLTAGAPSRSRWETLKGNRPQLGYVVNR